MDITKWTGEYCFSDADNPANISFQMLNNTRVSYYFQINGVNTPTFEAKPDANNQIGIFFNSILQSYLSSELPRFSSRAYVNRTSNKALLRCLLYVAQGADNFSVYVTILNGGLPLYEYYGNSFFNPSLVILTKQPAAKLVSGTQKEYISIIPKVSSANLMVNGVPVSALALQVGAVNIIDVSPLLMGIAPDAKTYSISFEGNSYVQTYELAKPTHFPQKYFVFLNSLGVFETALLRGLKESQNERTDRTGVSALKNYDKYKGKNFVLGVEQNRKFKINTGYLKKGMLEYYATELFFSREVYEYISPIEYRQIRITSKNAVPYTENIDLVSLNFECEYL